MRIAGQILEHVLGTTKGRFGVDDPLGLTELVQPGMKASRVSQLRQLSAELKLAFSPSRFQIREQLAPEQAAEDSDGEEEFSPARDPARPIQSQPSSGDHAMHMRMMEQVLAPGVKHGEK